MSTPQKPSPRTNIAQTIFHAISFGALMMGMIALLAALSAPSSYTYNDREIGYLAGIYNALISLSLFTVFVLIQGILYFVRRGANANRS